MGASPKPKGLLSMWNRAIADMGSCSRLISRMADHSKPNAKLFTGERSGGTELTTSSPTEDEATRTTAGRATCHTRRVAGIWCRACRSHSKCPIWSKCAAPGRFPPKSSNSSGRCPRMGAARVWRWVVGTGRSARNRSPSCPRAIEGHRHD